MRGSSLAFFRPIPGSKEWVFRFEVFSTTDISSLSLKRYMAAEARQWEESTAEKVKRLKAPEARALQDFMSFYEYESSSENIAKLYEQAGHKASLPRLESIFSKLNNLAMAISILIQGNQSIPALLWGSTQFALSAVLRFDNWIDDVARQLEDLVQDLPRFDFYTEDYSTPEVRKALQAIYDDYVDFCIAVAVFFHHRSDHTSSTYLKMRYRDIKANFTNTKKRLGYHKQSFLTVAHQAGAALSAISQQVQMMVLSPRLINRQTPIFVVPFPRNPSFTGRVQALQDIHDVLSGVGQQSITLHGIGGIGKTQLALEYCFRFASTYSAVCWVSAETEIAIANSYTEIARKLGVGGSERTTRGKVEAAKDWFDANSDWLLIIDNADDVELVQTYWPLARAGSIILTTQNLGFINFTMRDLLIERLPLDEGTELVVKQLRRGDMERSLAESLCQELGGMPLAISHVSGYAFRTNLGAGDVLKSLRQKRSMTEDIWNAPPSIYYSKKLDVVWDLALNNLMPSAIELLNVLAFLDPDGIQEAIITGDSDVLNLGANEEVRASKLRPLLFNLRERHLIERDDRAGEFCLRLHRSFRWNILHRLDAEPLKRQDAFEKAFAALRDVFPRITFTSRTEDRWPIVQKYMPQVLSLQTCYSQSEPRVKPSVEFADLLCDAGTFLWEQNIFKDSMPMLYLAEEICDELILPSDPNPIMAQVLESIAVFENSLGSEPRRKSAITMRKVQQMRRDFYDQIPEEQRTQNDEITLCRSWADTAASLIGLYEIDEAGALYERTWAHYHKIGTEQSIPYRFAHLYYNFTWLRILQKREQEGLDLARRSYELGSRTLGEESTWVMAFHYMWACALFSAGHLTEALQMHREVLADRLRILHETMAHTLLSYYMVGTLCYYAGEYEAAEKNLREALKHRIRANWLPIEVARTAFRLTMVLRAQRRHDAAVAVEQDKDYFPETAIPPGIRDGSAVTPDEKIAQYDFEVSLWRGRTEGLCKPPSLQPPSYNSSQDLTSKSEAVARPMSSGTVSSVGSKDNADIPRSGG